MTKAEIIKALECYEDDAKIYVSYSDSCRVKEEFSLSDAHDACNRYKNTSIESYESRIFDTTLKLREEQKTYEEAQEKLSKRETKKWRAISDKAEANICAYKSNMEYFGEQIDRINSLKDEECNIFR